VLFAAVHESPRGTSRHFAATQDVGRFRTEADMNRQARPAASVANDPTATSSTLNICDRLSAFSCSPPGRKVIDFAHGLFPAECRCTQCEGAARLPPTTSGIRWICGFIALPLTMISAMTVYRPGGSLPSNSI
jgi:hypothetical protein